MSGTLLRPVACLTPIALLSLLLGACAPAPSERPAPAAETAEHVDSPDGRQRNLGARDHVSLRTIDETEFAEVLRSHRGKVVLVDFWATWCPPCIELFPHTVELHEEFAARGLVVISVSFDDPQSKPEVRSFLDAKGATFQNFISPYGVSPRSPEAFGIDDGALPHFKLYNPDGDRVKTFGTSSGPFGSDDVRRAVENLLGST